MVVLAIPLRSIWRSLFEKSLPPTSRRAARATIITPPLRDRRVIGRPRKSAFCMEHRNTETHSTSRQSFAEQGSTLSAVITRFECLDRPRPGERRASGPHADAKENVPARPPCPSVAADKFQWALLAPRRRGGAGPSTVLLLLPRHSRLFKNPTSI